MSFHFDKINGFEHIYKHVSYFNYYELVFRLEPHLHLYA